jgi:hypothetical protein
MRKRNRERGTRFADDSIVHAGPKRSDLHETRLLGKIRAEIGGYARERFYALRDARGRFSSPNQDGKSGQSSPNQDGE